MATTIRIVGSNLPGSSCGPAPTESGRYSNIHLGLQRGQEVVAFAAGDAETAEFEFEVTVRGGRIGGPYVHGRNGQRFVYLPWGEVIDGEFRMFRRAKLHLDDLDPADIDGRTVVAEVSLTDAKGHPTCASLRPPTVQWSILDQ